MTEAEIRTALGAHLSTMVECPPITWPAKPKPRDPVYLVVEFVTVTREALTIGGTAERQTGYMQVTVCAELGAYEGRALFWADAIAQHCPRGMRLDEGSTSIEIPQPPSIAGQGYPDGAHWRLPVRVPYLALSA